MTVRSVAAYVFVVSRCDLISSFRFLCFVFDFTPPSPYYTTHTCFVTMRDVRAREREHVFLRNDVVAAVVVSYHALCEDFVLTM